jgi:hypothetical protein
MHDFLLFCQGTKYDILSFLYSVVLTKGPNRIVNERQDMEESLIGRHKNSVNNVPDLH